MIPGAAFVGRLRQPDRASGYALLVLANEFPLEAGGCPAGTIAASLHLLTGYDLTIMG
jgi:hypothetical protein